MKRNTLILLLAVLLAGATFNAKAQNLQVFYDTERGCVTSTLEMFRPDAFGSTFYFVDMDYNPTVSAHILRLLANSAFGKTLIGTGCRYMLSLMEV